jgi:hypothetical protein
MCVQEEERIKEARDNSINHVKHNNVTPRVTENLN